MTSLLHIFSMIALGFALLLGLFGTTWAGLAALGADPTAAALGGLFVLMGLAETILAMMNRVMRQNTAGIAPPTTPA